MSINIQRNQKKRVVIVGEDLADCALQKTFTDQACRWC